MDDVKLTATTCCTILSSAVRWMLTALERTVTWASMRFKANESRSLVIKRGQTSQRFTLQVQRENIPSVVDNSMKCLGKWYDARLRYMNNTAQVTNQLQEHLKQIDQS